MITLNIASSRFSDIQEKAERVIKHIVSLLDLGFSLNSSTSYGKDSSCVLTLFLIALKRAVDQGIQVQTCYVLTSNTLLENPAMDVYVQEMQLKVKQYCIEHNLDVHVVEVEPSLASTFQYATVGRGKLVRTAATNRECSVDWKIRPANKWLRSTLKSLQGQTKLVTLVGTRFSESSSRKANMENRNDGPTTLVPQDESGLYFQNSVIADFSTNEVWELLMACDQKRGGIYQSYVPNFDWTLDLYRDANEGVCVAISPDGNTKRAGCGSRFGCSLCPVTGEHDKSAEAMIAADPLRYSNLVGLSKLRNYLTRTYNDFSKRDWFQKELSDAGYVALSPDYYHATEKRNLLRYMISLDVLEEQRAERMSMLIARGDVEDNFQNRQLSHPQFQLITPRLLLAINFSWALNSDFTSGFQALFEWVDIRLLGRLSFVPDIDSNTHEKKAIPAKRWFSVGTFDHPWNIDGLRNIVGESINAIRKPDRPTFAQYADNKSGKHRKVTYFEQADELEIDSAEANLFLLEFEDSYMELFHHNSQDVVAYLLDRGIVKIGRGHISKYDKIARRGQYFQRLRKEFTDINQFAFDHSISDRDHQTLLDKLSKVDVEVEDQFDLFDLLAAS